MLIRKLEDFRRWSAGFNWSFFAFDTETTGLDWFELDIEGISFCDGISSAYVDFVDNKDREAILTEFFNTVISSHCVEKVVGHNLVFDLKVLAKLYGKAAINDFMYHTVLIDTYLAAYLLDERENHSLKKPGGCCERYLNRFPTTFTDVESQNRRSEKFAKYAEDDAINTWDLWQVLRQEIFDQNLQQVFFIESRFIPVQVEMELSGITVDQDLLKELETNLDMMKLELIGELEKIAGPGLKLQQGLFGNSDIERKLNSPKEMVSFITNHLGVPVVNTSAETIAEHNDKHPFFPLFAKYKVVHTLLSNFVSPYWDWIKPDGKVHPHFRIQRSGRIAAIEPHLSNQAKENEKLPDVNIRSLLTAGEGNSLLRIDYSGQEMRIDAHLTGDENMIRAFRGDIDVHMFVANRVNKLGIPEEYLVETHPKYKEIREKYAAERTKFKAINFGLIYGKAQPLYAVVLTPSGFVKMGDLHIGDTVYTATGKKTKIVGIYPQGLRPVYRVHFTDKTFADCDEEHLWKIQTKYDRQLGRYRILPLSRISHILKKGIQNNCYVERCLPIEFDTKEFTIPPYLMGLYLGDGHSSGGCFAITQAKEAIVNKLKEIPLSAGYSWRKDGITYFLRNPKPGARNEKGQYQESNVYMSALRKFNLLGKRSWEKFIPTDYLLADISQRQLLLKGLLDSDGCKNLTAWEYCTTSEQLAKNVKFLVMSLGGRCTITSRYTVGFGKMGRKSFRVFVSLPPHLKPKTISKVEYVGETECQCIQVAHPSGLYITDDFIVTHNTVAGFAREWKVEYMEAAKVVGDFFQEFPKIREAMDYWKKFQARTGYTVNCVGRRRRYNQPMDDGSYRSGFNHLHQSLGADMMKKAAGECWRYIHQKNLPIDIVLTIHDELMFEGPETLLRREEPNFCQIMTSTMKLNVPIKVESKIVKTYGD